MPRYAAIDIGSNSIRMQTAEVTPGEPIRILAEDREVTRLGESVFRTGLVSEEALGLAAGVLGRMAETYRRLDVLGVRAVATSAIRDTRNQEEFLQRASLALGAPVEIISGREEARLIQLGVRTRWPHAGKRLLAIDIGGGSAEIIASEDGVMREAFSRPLGAVRLKGMFLESDPPRAVDLLRMEEYIEEKLAGGVKALRGRQWDRAIATSATASAVVSAVHRVPRAQRDMADRLRVSKAQVAELYGKLSAMTVAGRRKVTGIGPRRADIIVPGLAVLLHFLRDFELPSLYYCRAGLRDGLIADLAARSVGKERSRLSREQQREVESMARKYGVQLKHVRQVAELAHELFIGMQPLHHLPPQYGKLLTAAAVLHDVGHYVSDSAHHKHSYYLVANSDMPGFTAREREVIANLARYHRKAMPVSEHGAFQALSAEEQNAVVTLIPILRLADNLDRGHEQRVSGLECRVRDAQVVVEVSGDGDTALEQWAGEQTGESFRSVYGRELVLVRARRS